MNLVSKLQSQEWLEADGLGGFASGTAAGIRTRRYHALLLTATTPPTGRLVLVNGFDAWVQTPKGKFSLSSQCYAPDVIGGDGAERIAEFSPEPWPKWIYKLEDGTRIEFEVFSVKGDAMSCLSWRLLGPGKDVKLFVRPFLSGRDYHSLHKANPSFRFDAGVAPGKVSWQPYPDVPGVLAMTNGNYSQQPEWYYKFLYREERERGLECEEDLAAPGILEWDLAREKAVLIFSAKNFGTTLSGTVNPLELFDQLRTSEKTRREVFPTRLHKSADSYIVERRSLRREAAGAPNRLVTSAATGKTIIAGYPWFADWGRDTFIALRGLCLASGRLDDARNILLAWAESVSEGMLPNRFPDSGEKPEFNSVDASLWFVVAVHEYLQLRGPGGNPAANDEKILHRAVEAILDGYTRGTRFGIRADLDGLLACGEPGVQLTWMDAKVGDWVVTPRIGKPVEIQALWLNALWIANQFSNQRKELFERGCESFRNRFWNAERELLHDVVDANHHPGEIDSTFRPNQLFAVGGLPFQLIEGERARKIVDAAENHLLTPLGMRSSAPGEPGYARQYCGGVWQRDGGYHQGTVWPWLIGPFAEAWVRVRGGTDEAKREASNRFLKPLLEHLDAVGLGHISEIADAEAPHTPRGCPFQAWSVGEMLRLNQIVLRINSKKQKSKKSRDLAAA